MKNSNDDDIRYVMFCNIQIEFGSQAKNYFNK